MKVSELIAHLQNVQAAAGDLDIVYSCCSDWVELEKDEITIQPAARVWGQNWRMRYHETANAAFEDVLTFPGN